MRRRTRLASLTAAVGDLAASLRRARDARAELVRVYDASGHGRTLDMASNEAKAALEAAIRLIDGVADLRKLQENGADRR
jgi:hypothetical protein